LAAARRYDRCHARGESVPEAGTRQGHRRQVEPDWASTHRKFKRKHVTLSIIWDEHIACNPEGYRYSRFCELYRI
jgi:transposase